jgi:glycosyltransferase involved in cell wall biosynthesis
MSGAFANKVDVLMSVYNGEKYLAEQIESVLNQDYKDFVVHIRDDGSTDRSVDIIRHYARRNPDKIFYTVADKNSGSAAGGFFALLADSYAPYVMFCDQDDVWFKNKISLSMQAMLEAELQYGINVPLLLHTDLTVTDSSLKIKSESMFRYQHLDYRRTEVKSLAVQNIVTGCTMLINRSLAARLTHIPQTVPVHDWWIALFAACCGKIVFLNKPTLYYRQHGENACGAQNMSGAGYLASRLTGADNARLMLRYGYRQAAEMSAVYGISIGRDNFELLTAYGELEYKPYPKRLAFVLKNGVLKSGLIRKLGQVIYL